MPEAPPLFTSRSNGLPPSLIVFPLCGSTFAFGAPAQGSKRDEAGPRPGRSLQSEALLLHEEGGPRGDAIFDPV